MGKRGKSGKRGKLAKVNRKNKQELKTSSGSGGASSSSVEQDLVETKEKLINELISEHKEDAEIFALKLQIITKTIAKIKGPETVNIEDLKDFFNSQLVNLLNCYPNSYFISKINSIIKIIKDINPRNIHFQEVVQDISFFVKEFLDFATDFHLKIDRAIDPEINPDLKKKVEMLFPEHNSGFSASIKHINYLVELLELYRDAINIFTYYDIDSQLNSIKEEASNAGVPYESALFIINDNFIKLLSSLAWEEGKLTSGRSSNSIKDKLVAEATDKSDIEIFKLALYLSTHILNLGQIIVSQDVPTEFHLEFLLSCNQLMELKNDNFHDMETPVPEFLNKSFNLIDRTIIKVIRTVDFSQEVIFDYINPILFTYGDLDKPQFRLTSPIIKNFLDKWSGPKIVDLIDHLCNEDFDLRQLIGQDEILSLIILCKQECEDPVLRQSLIIELIDTGIELYDDQNLLLGILKAKFIYSEEDMNDLLSPIFDQYKLSANQHICCLEKYLLNKYEGKYDIDNIYKLICCYYILQGNDHINPLSPGFRKVTECFAQILSDSIYSFRAEIIELLSSIPKSKIPAKFREDISFKLGEKWDKGKLQLKQTQDTIIKGFHSYPGLMSLLFSLDVTKGEHDKFQLELLDEINPNHGQDFDLESEEESVDLPGNHAFFESSGDGLI